MVKDIQPNTVRYESSSYPTDFEVSNGSLFFSINPPMSRSSQLWKTDGTEINTVLVKDFGVGSGSYYPLQLTDVNGKLFCIGWTDNEGFELWSNAEGTLKMVKDIWAQGDANSINPMDKDEFASVNGVLIFKADNGPNGQELWRSDGTASGTYLLKDINPGVNGSVPRSLTNVNGLVYFSADDGTNGRELWQSDGTPDGTVLVWDINPGPASSGPKNLSQSGDTLFFSANNGTHGAEPFGSAARTAPWIVASTPKGTTVGVDQLQFQFSKPMDQDSFTVADDIVSFAGPNGPLTVTGANWIAADTLRLTFDPQRIPGRYQLVLGPEIRSMDILSVAGVFLDQNGDGVAGQTPQDRYTAAFDIVADPRVISHSPSGDQTEPVSQVTVVFNQAINSQTFTAQDVTIEGPNGLVPVSGNPVRGSSDTEYVIHFAPQTAYGDYHVYVGPNIINTLGQSMDQDRDGMTGEATDDRYDASFTLLDVTGPWIVSHVPDKPVQGPFDHVDVTFSEALRHNSFDTSDVALSGPGGVIATTSVEVLDPNIFRVHFPAQTAEGVYRFVIGPNIQDLSSNWLDQDQDGLMREPSDQYTGTCVIDTTGPNATGNSLTRVQNAAVRSFEMTFNEAIDPLTFTPNLVTVTGPDNAGGTRNVPATMVAPLADNRFRVTIPGTEADGTYRVTISPALTDLAGNRMLAAYEFEFVQQLPDLVVTGSVYPLEGLPGQQIEVLWTVTNVGLGRATGTWTDIVSLSVNAQGSNPAELARREFNQPLEPGESYTRVATVTVPAGSLGSRWIVLKTDALGSLDEVGGENNTRVQTPALLVTTRPYPDLRVANVAARDTLFAGEAVTISWTVQNAGTGATTAGLWYDALYLSTDATLDSSDLLLTKVRNVEFLGPGESYVQLVDVTVPVTVSRVTYYLIAATDVTNTVQEFDRENNNATASDQTCELLTPPPPFLSVTDVRVSGPVAPGTYPSFTWTVTNTGGTTVPTGYWGSNWDDGLLLSRDPVYQADQDYFLGSHTFWGTPSGPLLGPRGSYTSTGHPEHPIPDWEPGDYYLIVLPDTHFMAGAGFGESTIGRDYGVAQVRLEYTVPDLVPISLTAPVTAIVGQPLRMDWRVENRGSGQTRTSSWSDEIYLSTDDNLDAQDTPLGAITHNGTLSVGAGYTATGSTFAVPGSVSAGTYRLILKTDAGGTVPERDETNNLFVSSTTLTVTRVVSDLQVVSAQGPATGVAGQSAQIDWTVVNGGSDTTAASTWSDAIYLADSATFDPSKARLLGQYPHSGVLTPQATYSRSEPVLLPERTEGTRYLFLVLDTRNELFELGGEDNNVRPLGAMELTDLEPDLSVIRLVAPDVAIAGRTISVDWRIENVGTASAGSSWQDAVYLSQDDVLGPEDGAPLLTLTRTLALGVGDGYSPADTPVSLVLPDGLEGTYYLILAVDSGKTVYEKGSKDNNIAKQAIQITDLVPDLRIQSATVPAAGRAGQFIVVDYAAVNQGQETATGSWKDAFYLSLDDQFQPATDRLIGLLNHTGSVDVGGTYGPRITPAYLRLPERIEGTFRVFVVADSGGVVPERDGEANNVYLLPDPITVALTPADLQVSVVQTPSEATAGTLVHVAWTVTNQGPEPTAENTWRDGVYLSMDAEFEPAADFELGLSTHTGVLGPGESYSESQDFQLRQDLEGPYYVYAVTDVRHQVYEYQGEDNNTIAAGNLLTVMGVHADLQVTTLDGPAQAITGDPVTISWTVTNAGPDATPASSWSDSVYLSGDDVLDTADTLLGTFVHNGRLPAGGSYAQSRSVIVPLGTAALGTAGTLHVLVKTDAGDKVYEYQAENNNTATVPLEVSLAPPTDLQVTQVAAPATAWSGQSLHVEWTVTNAGGTPAIAAVGGWYDNVYLSRDAYLDIGTDLSLGAVLHSGSLAADGGSYTAGLDARLPPGISGPYFVFVMTDTSKRAVERGAEGNNVSVSPPNLEVHLTPPADLVPTRVAPPPSAFSGEAAVWEYDVTNNGTLDAVGSWYDSLYLSTDSNWDIDDVRIACVLHQGDIAHDQYYTGTVTADTPPVLPGNYYLIVRTDILDHVRESAQDETNNTAISMSQVVVGCRELPLDGAGATGQLRTAAARYYQVTNVPAGRSLLLNLDVAAENASTELYVRYGDLPTRSQYDLASLTNSQTDQRVIVPTTQSGTYYVLVYGERVPGVSTSYSLQAALAQFAVYDTNYGRGGTAGNLTIEINGADFDRQTTASLADGVGFQLPATAYYYVNGTQFYATFDLTKAVPGTYDVAVQSSEGALATVTRGLEVVAGGGGTNVPTIQVPSLVRWGREFQFTVTWGNDGLNDAPAPLLTVGGSQAFGFSPGDRSAGTRYTFLGTCTDGGPAGILRPGHRETMTFSTTADQRVGPYEFYVDREYKNGSDSFDSSGIRDQVRPTGISDQEFDTYFLRLASELGTSNRSYLDALAKFASSAPVGPQDVRDPTVLLQFEMGQVIAAMTPSVSGKLVTHDSSLVLASRTVSLRVDDLSPAFVTETFADGTFTFSRLPAGSYHLEADGLLVLPTQVIVVVTADEHVSGLSVEVGKGATLSGRLYAPSNVALGSALVSVISGTGLHGASYAAANGYFEVTGLATGVYTVVVDHPGLARTWQSVAVGLDTVDMGTIEIVSGSTVIGSIRTAANAILPSGVITLERLDTPAIDGFSTLVNTGSFALTHIPDGTYNLAVVVDGVVEHRVSGLVVSGNAVDLGTITLSDFASISGTVVSQVAGLSLAMLHVGIFCGGQLISAGSVGSGGGFSLPAIPPGNYALQVIGAEDQGISDAVSISLLGGQTLTGVDLCILKGGTIGGTVHDSALTPLAGVHVQLILSDGTLRFALTDSTGGYVFQQLPIGRYMIGVAGSCGFTAAEIGTLMDTHSSLDILVPQIATLNGTVVVGDAPAAGAIVQLFRGENPVAESSADQQGHYSFSLLQEGDYRVVATASNATFFAGIASHVAPGDVRTVDIHSGEKSLQIEVLDSDGAAVSEAEVSLLSAELGLLNVSTSIDGRVQILHLVPGTYDIRVQTRGSLVASSEVHVIDGDSTVEQLIVSQGCSVSGVVRDHLGMPISNATVEVLDSTTGRRVGGSLTNDAGEYQVNGIAASTCTIAVFGDGFARTEIAGIAVVGDTVVNISANQSQAQIVGRVVCGTTPVPFGWVVIYDAGGKALGVGAADVNGVFRVEAIRESGLKAVIAARGYAPATIANVSVSSDSMSLGDVELLPVAVPRQGLTASLDQATAISQQGSIQRPVMATSSGAGSASPQDILQDWFFRLLDWISAPKVCDEHTQIPDPITDPCLQARCGAKREDLVRAVQEQDRKYEAAEIASQTLWGTAGEYYARITQLVADGAAVVGALVAVAPGLSAAGFFAPTILGSSGAAVVAPLILAVVRAKYDVEQSVDDFAAASSPGDLAAAATSAVGITGSLAATAVDARNAIIEAANNRSRELQAAQGLDIPGKIRAVNQYLSRSLAVFNTITYVINTYNTVNGTINTLARQLENIREEYNQKYRDYEQAAHRARVYEFRLRGCLAEPCGPCSSANPPPDCNPCKSPNPPDACDDGAGGGSHDPNDKLGPEGYDVFGYIAPGAVLPYTVRFENDPKATASAVLVTISDQMDSDLDWNTFQLGSMQFGSHVISVPEGRTYYETRIDLRPDGNNLLVDVEASFNTSTGLAQWTFTGIDPATGEPTDDPLAGFLPPNNPEVHDGEGFVQYTLYAKSGLPTVTQITNTATIVFDWNEPIDTPTIKNTIDAGAPASAVDPLPVQVSDAYFLVSWAGADDAEGSGIRAYDIFVSTDDDPYQVWLRGATATAATFRGEFGRRYAFYSVATDNVGHVEAAPGIPDALTRTPSGTASIGDRVWLDVNGDGIQDPGELGLGGVTVRLADANDTLVASTTTDQAGYYRFESLETGRQYYLTFEIASGLVFSPQDQGSDDTRDSDVNPASGRTSLFSVSTGEYLDWDAGLFEPAEIRGTLYDDQNHNGWQDAGELGLAQRTVFLDQNGNGELDADEPFTVTDDQGNYRFTGLLPGEYVVQEVADRHWPQTYPGLGGTDDRGQPTLSLDFRTVQYVQANGVNIQALEYSVPTLVDWNNDGMEDLLVGEKVGSFGKIRVYLNQGDATHPVFSTVVFVQAGGQDLMVPAAGCLGVFPRVADFNGDGRKDLVLGLADGRVQLFLNINTDAVPEFAAGTFLQVGPTGAKQSIDVGERAALDVIDWNADGLLDLVVGSLDGRVRVYLNEGTAQSADFRTERFVQDAQGDLVVPSGRSSVAVTDLDRDGLHDLVLGNTDGQLYFCRNVGSPTVPRFEIGQRLQANGVDIDVGTLRSRPFVHDFDGDGLTDVLVGGADGLIRLYTRQPMTASPAVPPLTPTLFPEYRGGEEVVLRTFLAEPTAQPFAHTVHLVSGEVREQVNFGTLFANQPPVADPGGPYTIGEGDSLSLDAFRSNDLDQDPLTFRWDINGDGVFADALGVRPTIAWSQLRTLGVLDNEESIVTVEVDDGYGGFHQASATLTIHNTLPSATVNQAAGQADPAPAAPVHFTIVFSEPVTGFTVADVLLGGTAPGTRAVTVTAVDMTTYDVAISGMTGNGTVTATVAAEAAVDAAGNLSLASTSQDETVMFWGDPWQNYPVVYDATDDDTVTPLDALVIIHCLNTYGQGLMPRAPTVPGEAPIYVDIDGNGWVTPLDVLLVIHYLNQRSTLVGQGESVGNDIAATLGDSQPARQADAGNLRVTEPGQTSGECNCPVAPGEWRKEVYPQVGLPRPIGTVWEDSPPSSWVSYFPPHTPPGVLSFASLTAPDGDGRSSGRSGWVLATPVASEQAQVNRSESGPALTRPSPSGLASAAIDELDDVLNDIASDVALGWDRGGERG